MSGVASFLSPHQTHLRVDLARARVRESIPARLRPLQPGVDIDRQRQGRRMHARLLQPAANRGHRRLVGNRRISIGFFVRRLRRVARGGTAHAKNLLGRVIPGRKRFIGKRPAGRCAVHMATRRKILAAVAIHDRAEELRVAADIVVVAGQETFAVRAQPLLGRTVKTLLEDGDVVARRRAVLQMRSPFEDDDPEARRREAVRQGGSADAGADDDDVCRLGHERSFSQCAFRFRRRRARSWRCRRRAPPRGPHGPAAAEDGP